MARPVTQRSPDDRDRLQSEQVAARLNLREILHLERDMMQLGFLAGEEVHRVMVRVAAQKREEVSHPVRNTETEHLLIERCHLLGIVDDEGDVPEFERADSRHLVMASQVAPFRKQLDRGALRIFELQDLADARDRIVAQFVGDAVQGQPTALRGEVGVRRHFERQAGALRGRALVEPNRQLPDLRCQVGTAGRPFGEHQPVDLGVIVDGPFEIAGVETGVADSSCLDHGRMPARRLCRTGSEPAAFRAGIQQKPLHARPEPDCAEEPRRARAIPPPAVR